MPYGCFNRKPLRDHQMIQDGWQFYHQNGCSVREPVMIYIPVPMTKTCQYMLTYDDPKCVGCRHNTRVSPTQISLQSPPTLA